MPGFLKTLLLLVNSRRSTGPWRLISVLIGWLRFVRHVGNRICLSQRSDVVLTSRTGCAAYVIFFKYFQENCNSGFYCQVIGFSFIHSNKDLNFYIDFLIFLHDFILSG